MYIYNKPLQLLIVVVTSCGPLGNDTSDSWNCMIKGGNEYCERQTGPKGDKGDTGSPGRTGQQGVPGPIGPSGGVGSQGPVGSSGKPGAQGERGPQGTGGSTGSTGSQGSTGPIGPTGPSGPAGPTGNTGPAGPQGPKGDSCTIQAVVNGALISCQDGTNVVILNGEDGDDAPPTPYTVVSLVDPCGPQGSYDEVLMRLGNGQLMAHYANGSQQFLTIVGPGSYVTTDGTSCFFTIASDLSITNEHN